MGRVCLVAAAWAGLAASAGAVVESPHPVRADLLTDAGRLTPGSTVRLGVRLRIEPGWHVYWRNPGNAGLATAVDLALPGGLSAGPLAWPVPGEFDEPGGIVGYGYEGEVVLVRPLTVAASPPPSGATAKVRVSWLACRQRCVLGDAALETTLPVPVGRADRDRTVLDEWAAFLPAPAAAGPHATVRGGLAASGGEGRVTVWLQWPQPPGEVAWFPAPSDALEIRGVRVRSSGVRTRIDFTAAPRAGQGPPETVLDSVVAEDLGTRRKGFVLPVRLEAAGG